MFGLWLKSKTETTPPPGAEELFSVVKKQLPDADEETALVVVAMVGLLGAVAYADRSYSNDEEIRIREELGRVNGMTEAGIETICSALRRHIVEVSTVQLPRYARILVDLADHELRVQVLDALLEIAAADGTITQSETNMMRLMTQALGLSQLDYNRAQAKHRDRLAALQ
jgi:uncharacterized tellurite resistance protein B-like protein